MLSGMVFCMNCERPYSATALNGGRTGYRHRIKHGHCCNRWRNSQELETLVWNRVVEILLDPSSLRKGYEKMIEEEQEKHARRINHLEAIQKGIACSAVLRMLSVPIRSKKNLPACLSLPDPFIMQSNRLTYYIFEAILFSTIQLNYLNLLLEVNGK